MNPDAPLWRPVNNGSGKRIWFVVRGEGSAAEYHEGRDDRLVRFASGAAAQVRADQLNRSAER